MQVKTNVKGGAITLNHNEAQVPPAAQDLRVQTDVKGGAVPSNPGGGGEPGLKVQTGVKAGFVMKINKSSPKL